MRYRSISESFAWGLTNRAGIAGGTGDFMGASGQIEFTAPPEPTANGPWGIDMTVCVPSAGAAAE